VPARVPAARVPVRAPAEGGEVLAIRPTVLAEHGLTHAPRPHLPAPELTAKQAAWLAGPRARLLRRADIARRERVLDLGCGWGQVTEELQRRCGGGVVSLDWEMAALTTTSNRVSDASPVCADGRRLPFRSGSFDLVFSQNALLWMGRPATWTVHEVAKVLAPGGVLAALEPDFGGMMEYPRAIAARELWIAALFRARADPFIGRHLPPWLKKWGFSVSVELVPGVQPPQPERFELLAGLPFSLDQREQLGRIRARAEATPNQLVHLPYFLILATKGTAT